MVTVIALRLSNDEIMKKIYVSPPTAKNPRRAGDDQPAGQGLAQLVVFAY